MTQKPRKGEKRVEWILEKQVSGKKDRMGRLTKEDQESNEGKRHPAARVRDLRYWFEGKGRGNSSSLGQETDAGKASNPEMGTGKERKGNVDRRLEPTTEKYGKLNNFPSGQESLGYWQGPGYGQ